MFAKLRSSYYYRLVLSYTVLALVLIGITGGFLLSNANQLVMSEVSKDARYGLLNVKNVVEDHFLRLFEDAFFSKVLSTVSSNSSETLTYLLSKPADGNIYRIVSFINDLGLVTDTTEGLDGISVYFRQHNYAIDQDRYYAKVDNARDASFMAGLPDVRPHHWFVREKPGDVNKEAAQVLTYVYTLPYMSPPDKASGYLYLDIRLEHLQRLVQPVLNNPETQFYIFNPAGERIFGSREADEGMLNLARHWVLDSAGETSPVTTRTGGNILSVLPARDTESGWSYVVVKPMESFLLSADKMKRQVWQACLLALLGGILVSFLMSRHFYMPLKKVLYSIRHLYKGPAPVVGGSEYAAIDQMLMFIDLSMLQMKDQVRLKQISGLITGQQSAAAIAELPAMPLECRYAVAVIYTQSASDGGLTEVLEQNGMAAEWIGLASNEYALLIYLYEPDAASSIIDVAEQVRSLQQAALENGISFHGGIGPIVASVDDIHQSYVQAVQASRYAFIYGSTAIMTYEETADRMEAPMMTLVDYTGFQNRLEAGEVAAVEHWVDELGKRLRTEPLKIEAIDLICLQLVTVMSQVVIEQKLHNSFVLADLHQCLKSATLQDALSLIRDYATSIAQHIQESRSNVHQEKMLQLQSYIVQHMAEDLSLEQLATSVQLSPNYVSTLFGSVTGESFNEYLNRIRLEHASELLAEDPHKSVATIAKEVGYRNSQYFCTKFKRKHGVTPLQYRQAERGRRQQVVE